MNLIDSYKREIKYLRISVTDRCDLRCQYCMKEKMTFLPKKEVLTLEEEKSMILEELNRAKWLENKVTSNSKKKLE